MGQQKGQRNESHPAVEPGHVKNSKSRFQTDRKIPSENEGKSSDFTPYGMAVKIFFKDFFEKARFCCVLLPIARNRETQ